MVLQITKRNWTISKKMYPEQTCPSVPVKLMYNQCARFKRVLTNSMPVLYLVKILLQRMKKQSKVCTMTSWISKKKLHLATMIPAATKMNVHHHCTTTNLRKIRKIRQ